MLLLFFKDILEAKKDGIKAEISRICIAGRNQYSKSAIQQDFAAGIKEIDQENAAEEDEEVLERTYVPRTFWKTNALMRTLALG